MAGLPSLGNMRPKREREHLLGFLAAALDGDGGGGGGGGGGGSRAHTRRAAVTAASRVQARLAARFAPRRLLSSGGKVLGEEDGKVIREEVQPQRIEKGDALAQPPGTCFKPKQDAQPREEKRSSQEKGSCCAAAASSTGGSCCAAAASGHGGSCCDYIASASSHGGSCCTTATTTGGFSCTTTDGSCCIASATASLPIDRNETSPLES
uniref:Uncharacterized protein n=1 Tax=Oryza punctata TaxID=4537 RepID=A0A0E0L632_ORYPU